MRIPGTGTVYQPTYRTRAGEVKKSGVWWWKLGSRRTSTHRRTEADAQKWVISRLVEMQRGDLAGVERERLRYDDLERMLLTRWEADGRKGIQQAVARLRYARKAFAGWKVEALTTDQFTEYALSRRRAGAAVATVNLELALVRRAFSIAREAGRVQWIPLIKRLPKPNRRSGVVERGDFEAIMSVLPSRYRAPIEFLYWTGWREGEALSLTWQHVDLGAGELRLDPQNSKTGQGRMFYFPPGSAIQSLLLSQWERRGFSPYVFPGRNGGPARLGRPMDRTALQKAWRAACRQVGVPAALIHDLRRTAARDLRRAGASLAVAQDTLGHRDLGIHLGYSVVDRSDRLEAVAKLEALRAGEPVQQRLVRMSR